MYYRLNKWGFVFIMMLLVNQLTAQIVGTYKKLEVGAGLGLTFYSGDVAPSPNIRNTRGGGEIFVRYNFNPALSARATLGGYVIAGIDENRDDPFQNVRSHSFATRMQDLSVVLEYNFFNFRGNQPYPKFSPYIFAGLGIMRGNIKIENAGFSNANGERVDFGSINAATTIPFGVGIKFPFTEKFNIAFELRANKTFTDFIDGLGTAPDDPVASTDERFMFGTVEGNDFYMYLGVSVAYRFVKLKCPKYYPSKNYDFK